MEFIQEALKEINKAIERETEMLAFSPKKGFEGLELKEENFHELGLFSEEKELVAVDGGNAEILSSSGIYVEFIRIAGIKYKGGKRKEAVKKEFLCLIRPETGKTMKFKADIYGDSLLGKGIEINQALESPDGEIQGLEIGDVGNIIRRLSELKLAADLSDKDSIVVIDGSIEAKAKEEVPFLKNLLEKGNCAFLCKTCRMLTKNGNSLNAALNELGPKSSWYYYPVFEINNPNYFGEMYFAKLNSKSRHVFKLELRGDAEMIILALSMNSNDSVFYGYPYCLIEADKLARVSNREKEYLKTIILSKVDKKERLKSILSGLDAHDILDRIS